MRRIDFVSAWLTAALSGLPTAIPAQENPAWSVVQVKAAKVHYTPGDAGLAPALADYVNAGTGSVEKFFGHPFPRSIDVYVFPRRAALDAQWQQDWGAPDFRSECWMVASGVAHRLDLLSPSAWAQEACEHDSTDQREIQQLVTHELVHVYHGQHNPVPDFAGLEDLAWLIEGVATYASGQLDEERMARVKQVVQEGKAPTSLSRFWSGKDKYGLAGSLASCVDERIGRAQLFELLKETKQDAVLSKLGMTEAQLIERWKASVGP
jgi:hypothetical protein